MLLLFLLWLTHFIPLRNKVVNFLPATMCYVYTVSERAWWNFETYDNRNILGEDEFANFLSKTNVVQICNISNNLGFWVILLETRQCKVQLVVLYPVLIHDWHDIFIMINSHRNCMLWINSVQDPSHVIWLVLGIGFYNRWFGKTVRVTFSSWPGVESWRVDSIQCPK